MNANTIVNSQLGLCVQRPLDGEVKLTKEGE